MKKAVDLMQIIKHHFAGGRFMYDSYDHAKAEAEFKQTNKFKELLNDDWGFRPESKIDKQIIPEEIREKYAILKNGKLRSIDFAPNGSVRGIKIGNRRPMNFYNYTANKITLI